MTTGASTAIKNASLKKVPRQKLIDRVYMTDRHWQYLSFFFPPQDLPPPPPITHPGSTRAFLGLIRVWKRQLYEMATEVQGYMGVRSGVPPLLGPNFPVLSWTPKKK